ESFPTRFAVVVDHENGFIEKPTWNHSDWGNFGIQIQPIAHPDLMAECQQVVESRWRRQFGFDRPSLATNKTRAREAHRCVEYEFVFGGGVTGLKNFHWFSLPIACSAER